MLLDTLYSSMKTLVETYGHSAVLSIIEDLLRDDNWHVTADHVKSARIQYDDAVADSILELDYPLNPANGE